MAKWVLLDKDTVINVVVPGGNEIKEILEQLYTLKIIDNSVLVSPDWKYKEEDDSYYEPVVEAPLEGERPLPPLQPPASIDGGISGIGATGATGATG